METINDYAPVTGARLTSVPRPRRRLAPPPPAPADPSPWEKALGGAQLSMPEFNLLSRMALRRHVEAGEVVLDCREPARHLVLLLSGDVVLGSRTADGALRTERSVTGPAWLDLSAAWLEAPYEMEAQALSDVVVVELPLQELRSHFAAVPGLAERFCVGLARRVHELTSASRNLLHNDAPARLAQWLLQRCPAEAQSCELRLQERKRDIAQQLAMTPETLSRLMRSFESRGLMEVRGYLIVLRDLPALRGLAGH